MNLDRYEFDVQITEPHVQYEFFSQGPQGLIKKIIRFENVNNEYYNLSFGDSIAGSEDFSDEITSNNGDTEKVLTTVAEAIMVFSSKHPKLMIHVQGSTPARSRLYRICINKHWKIANKNFYLHGQLLNNEWEKFRKNRNYMAFAGIRKNRYF
jgi:hypothetical protein